MRQRTRLVINVLSNYGAFAVYGIANFFLVGYVARVLGKDLFGVSMLVLSFTMISEILGWGVCLALTKHIAADVARKDLSRFHGLVNTSFVWLLGCSVFGAAVCAVLSVFIDRIANMPPELVGQARLAMLLMGLKVLLCFPLNTFQGILWAYQRYDLSNIARSVGIVARAIIVVLWYRFVSAGLPELIYITIFTMLLERAIWIYGAYKVADQIKLGLRYVSSAMFWMLLSFGGYVIVIQVSNLLGYEAIKWVVSIEKPVLEVGAYSLIATLAMFAGSMVRSIANVLMPTASSLHAQNLHDKNILLAILSTKYAMVISAAFCIVPLFLLEPMMTLWVGRTYSPDYLSQIAHAGMVLLVGQYIMDSVTCSSQMTTGMGKVAFLSVVTLCWAVGGLSAVWIYLHWFNGTIVGMALIIATARIIGSAVNLTYTARVTGVGIKRFLTASLMRPTTAGVVVCGVGYGLTKTVNVHSVAGFIMAIAALGILYVVATWSVTLSAEERHEILNRVATIGKSRREVK